MTRRRAVAMRAAFAATRLLRPALPPRYRYIAPYQQWRNAARGRGTDARVARARRAAGIRLGPDAGSAAD
jgi:hypothetical protein